MFSSFSSSFSRLWRTSEVAKSSRYVAGFASWLGFLWGVDNYVTSFVLLSGPSMMPTFNESNDIVLVDHISPRFSKWAPLVRNEIVIAKRAGDSSICKRLIGLPGDVIHHRDFSVEVPEDHVWLEGDNPQNSFDSRNCGPIPISEVKGRVIGRIWPWPFLKLSLQRPTSNEPLRKVMLSDSQFLHDSKDYLSTKRANLIQDAEQIILFNRSISQLFDELKMA